ncbi:MAG: DUF5612 domain-containing protein [Methanocellales archaeon]|nr:DUF5612 domain-containing protein [Methanocellales archaeon]MDD3291650.1 DUF5612 domain-containing protein [Methanocellales archaeon]MDD5235219.1 DUF5612 domain-containing protein [Methanocellales archaeon]MDD5485433.1 DUF5612 domain-containing protein [Methanocellales archaeon]
MVVNMEVISLICKDEPGVLRDVSGTVAKHNGNIKYVQLFIIERGKHKGNALIYMEIDVEEVAPLISDLNSLASVLEVATPPSFSDIYGSRVIIVGGGAQVAQVAMGAINEADRHNIRGERISIDTIPLVGEDSLADSVAAVSRLPRAEILILAGSLMGGRITKEVEKLREAGIPVIALNMAGSVPDAVDLVVTDPIQAGTFAVMHVAKTAEFDLKKVKGRRF